MMRPNIRSEPVHGSNNRMILMTQLDWGPVNAIARRLVAE
jgi:hypothetical protein